MNILTKWFKSLKTYFQEAWGEFKKVTWPGRKELMSTTLTVLAFVIFFGVFLGILDLLLTSLIGLYLK